MFEAKKWTVAALMLACPSRVDAASRAAVRGETDGATQVGTASDSSFARLADG